MSSATIWAGCKSDCRDEYDSEIESCKSQYDDPDDADELRQCIQNAKDEYESCIEECVINCYYEKRLPTPLLPPAILKTKLRHLIAVVRAKDVMFRQTW